MNVADIIYRLGDVPCLTPRELSLMISPDMLDVLQAMNRNKMTFNDMSSVLKRIYTEEMENVDIIQLMEAAVIGYEYAIHAAKQ